MLLGKDVPRRTHIQEKARGRNIQTSQESASIILLNLFLSGVILYFRHTMCAARYLTNANDVVKVIGSANNGQVLQLAVVQNELFALRFLGHTAQIEVYDAIEFSRRNDILVPGVTYATSLAACQRYNNCLYIGTVLPESIYRMDASTKTVTQLPVISNYWPVYRPSGLSVTREGKGRPQCRPRPELPPRVRRDRVPDHADPGGDRRSRR